MSLADGPCSAQRYNVSMALTIGTAPFGREPAGSFNFHIDRPDDALYFEDSPRRVRSVRVGDRLHEDLVWTYPEPLPGVGDIAGLLCFYDEKMEISVSTP